MVARSAVAVAAAVALAAIGCETTPELDARGQEVGYRTGTEDDAYRSNGERGNVQITEIFWAGSVRGGEIGGDTGQRDPDDVFIELLNKHPRPVHLTGWILTVEAGRHLDGMAEANTTGIDDEIQYVLPERVNREPIEPNEYVIIAGKRNGAFREADYYVDGLRIPDGPFEITLQDLDERLIDGAGDERKQPFAGSWDGVTARSMERVQLIFGNRGNRDVSWHGYSLHPWDTGERAELDLRLRARIHEDYRGLTFASPGQPNSPDYGGSVSSGSFE